MKPLRKYAWIRVLAYFMILGMATIVAGNIPALSDFWFFMLVAMASSWFLLKIEGKKTAVNILPRRSSHWIQFAWGTLAGCVLLLITAICTLFLTGDQWRFNVKVDGVYIAIVLLTCLWSSIVQEFVFRGYPFQTLLQHYNGWVAQWVILVPFALMHVHKGMDTAAVLTTFLTTGLGSLLFGLAYIKTRHLALPIGLHLGWNFAQALIPRSSGGNKDTLLIVSGNAQHYTFYNMVLPYVVVLLTAMMILSKRKSTFKITA